MTTLIVPCYNELERIDFGAFAKQSGSCRFYFIDDGSSDGTVDAISKKLLPFSHCRLLRISKNMGKAEAVRRGMIEVQKSDWFSNSDWIGFWDADLATPLSELTHFSDYAALNSNYESVWGSRVYRLGSRIERSALRHYMGRIFATLIHRWLGVQAYDTQCGAKLFRPQLIQPAFSEPFVSRWIFDVEILLRLGQAKIIEYPVQAWRDVPGSKVRFSRDIFKVLRDIFRIRSKYINASRQ